MSVAYEWRAEVADDELNTLHAEGFGHPVLDEGWGARLAAHSLGWVCAREGAELVGFVNVIGDGGVHAVVLDTAVAAAHRRQGIGTRLVQVATAHARSAGCEWLHVDFEPQLRDFYFAACGFRPTDAGLIALR